MTTAKPSVFISYSHLDGRWKDLVATHLRALEREGRLRLWHDGLIATGSDWLPQIQQEIAAAKAAVLLVSPAFLDSEFVLNKEVPAFLEQRSRNGLRVFPVLIEPCLWEEIDWLKRMQVKTYLHGKALLEVSRAKQNRTVVDLAKEILAALDEEPISSEERPARGSSPLLGIHQLPTPPGDFTGRKADLKVLKAAAKKGNTTAIFGLHGMGGVGKTALALKLAQEIAPLYPDGQIFLDLLGVTTPLSATEAMAHVIRSFYPGKQLPTSEAELASLYRSVLHGKRVLLLMDNASGKEQIVPLLPPEGSALLVTSRVRFALPGLVERDLDELPREESRELLLKICPRIGEHAKDLARACGDLPLALRVAASTLQERKALSPESYLQRLSTGRERLEPVETALSFSYELLSDELKLRWCQLAVFPDTFRQEAATAVWAIETEVGEPILAELERQSLVEWEEANRRYHLHDLVRSFVEERLEQTEGWAARERHAQHYLTVLWVTHHLYESGGEDLVRALRIFDLEWRNIQTGQAFAAAEAANSEEGARLCSDYPNAGVHCLLLRQPPGDRISWLEDAVAATQRLGNRGLEGTHLGNLGIAYANLGEPRRAIELYEQQLAIFREIGYRQGEVSALGSMGNAYRHLAEPRRAIELYEQVLALSRQFGDRWAEGKTFNNLGLAYTALGEPRRAIEYYEQRLAIARETGDRRGEGSTFGNLGVAYEQLAEPRRAVESYEQHLVIAREIGDRKGEANTSWNLGLIYKQEDPARAAKLMQVLVDFEREIGHPHAEANAAEVEAIRARISK